MVHALSEIRRVLVPGGILIDLRPVLDRWQIDVVSAREIRETGHVQDFPTGLADDEAANNSIAKAEQNGWFVREQEEFFLYVYSWNSPKDMEEWVEEEWEDFIGMDKDTKRAARSTWALADGDARVQLSVKMLIASWGVVKSP